jgi:cell division protein FtsX
MKELANGFAQLAAIIMILITLAISTAAVSQWANSDQGAQSPAPQTLLAAGDR